MPKLEPQIEFSVGIFSYERVKHLNFTVRRSGAILRRNLPRTFHQLLLFCSVASPAPPVLAARESHDPHLLACAGMAANIHSIDLDQAEQLLGAPGAPAVRSSSAGCCGRLTSRWVVLARGEFSRDGFSTSDDDHGVFGQLRFMNALVVHFSTGLWFARVRAASRCVLERLSWQGGCISTCAKSVTNGSLSRRMRACRAGGPLHAPGLLSTSQLSNPRTQ